MKLSESIKISFNTLKTNKMRSALTMLGIVIGVGSVILMMSLGNGAQNLVVGQVASMGSNNIYIEPGSPAGSMSQQVIDQLGKINLKASDAEAIAKNPNVGRVSSMIYGNGIAGYFGEDKKITFMGIDEEAMDISNLSIASGRGISKDDVSSMARIVVLGHKLAKDLFGEDDPIGKTIRIKKLTLRVVGILEEKGGQLFQTFDDYAYIPLTTVQKLLMGIDYINAILVKAKNEKVIDQVVEDARIILRERHGIYNPEGDLAKDDFKVMSQVEMASMLTQITSALTIFLSLIAAIALIVGGIGIMNIMLVSVTERTKEIGLRKAVGARNKDILNQFLLEAITLTLLGGLIGFVGGTSISFVASIVLTKVLQSNWVFTIPIGAVILSLVVATMIGLIFGIYPAKKASKLNPIEALRYE
ncbi:MAG TPA: ABC transporter permease [Candidatus Portnoybacteria bacterium]|jgi:putative ABC transport system permease protein|nr:ABC transporter permease [Candidatus Portnoybacteria bacterium]MDD5752325.1 ABC transporter permease [Candidatus Portnoybacteria bacterium]HNU96673.1 ABC transporter permease [Candidatus Portnoybacteria bacterium]HOZ16647.1 ABC transporter permease [Candidatus Portnoybacteria bacterium]HPH52373.1 ABC transporter permease [Candidatus Portnoybacteria bacterium]